MLQEKQKNLSDLLFLLLFWGALYYLFLGHYQLLVPDEGRYGEIARFMFASGDWITPHLNGFIFLDKPILFYWLSALSFKVWGVNEFALRFWPSSLALICVLATYIFSAVLINRRTALLSACILASTPLFYGGGHYANMDLEVAVWIVLSSYAFFIALEKPTYRTLALCIAYICVAAAFLTKGLIGFVFPAMIIGLWILVQRKWQALKDLHLFKGFILFLILVLPWLIAAQIKNPDFFHYFFYEQQFLRYLTSDFNDKAPFYFYALVILIGFLPWSLFLATAIYQASLKLKASDKSAPLFLLIGVLTIFVFFSIPASKPVGYILPVFPFLSVLVAIYFDKNWHQVLQRKMQFVLLLSAIVLVLLALGLFYIGFKQTALSLAPIPVFFAVAVCLLLQSVLLFMAYKKPLKQIFIFLSSGLVILLIVLMLCMPKIRLTEQVKALALTSENLPSDTKVYNYAHYFYALPFYRQQILPTISDWQKPDLIKEDSWKGRFVYAVQYQPHMQTFLMLPKDFWSQWQSEQNIAVFIKQSKLTDFDHKKYYVLAKDKNILLISNHPIALNRSTVL